jgi:hypothetical protein
MKLNGRRDASQYVAERRNSLAKIKFGSEPPAPRPASLTTIIQMKAQFDQQCALLTGTSNLPEPPRPMTAAELFAGLDKLLAYEPEPAPLPPWHQRDIEI